MQSTRRQGWLAAAVLAALVAGCASMPGSPGAGEAAPNAELDGLVPRPMKGLDVVYVRPGVTFKSFRTVQLDPLQVEFDKDWDPNRGRRELNGMVHSEDLQKMKDDMARDFRTVFAEELAAAGFEVVEQGGPETLRLTPKIDEVTVNAPDLMRYAGRSRSYTREAGEMTLHLDARDANTGQLLARVTDEYTGRDRGELQITDSVTNAADFRMAVRDWAKRLRSGFKVSDFRPG